MSLLPGRFIDKEVAKQIKKRQQVIGASKRLFDETDPKSYSFFLAKTPFIRLTSGIDKDGLQDPARQSILDNGHRGRGGDVASETPGYEYSDDFGVRPVAGITGMTVNTHNRYGSLRTATVQFEVHSLEQMNLYEEMFMRPGYSALLEWGHSVWLDSETGEVNDLPALLSEPFINKNLVSTVLKPGSSDDDIQNQSKQVIYQAIEEMRRRTNFNYDGMYGLIKNFSWSLRPDGGYSCTVDIVSIGTVVESLTLNANMLKEEVIYFYNLEDEGRRSPEVVKAISEPLSFKLQGEDAVETAVQTRIREALEQKIPSINNKFNLIEGYDARKNKIYRVKLKQTINTERRIIHQIDTSVTPYRILVRSEEYITAQNIIVNVEDTEAYRAWNGVEIAVQPEGVGPQEYYRIEFIEGIYKDNQGVPQDVADFKERAGTREVERSFWDLEFNLIRIAAPQAPTVPTVQELDQQQEEEREAVSNAAPVQQQSEIESIELILDTSKQFSSRVHLLLYLIKRRLAANISEDLKGVEPTEVYEEFDLDLRFDYGMEVSSQYKVGAVRRRLGEGTSDEFHHYIQLGTFLDILNKYIPKAKLTNKEKSVGESLFQFNTSKDNVHRYKTLEDLHASVDIVKCLLPDSYGDLSKFARRGDILQIFIEVDYLLGLVDKGLVNGDLKGYDIVTEILRDINISVGQINELALQYHEESFMFHVVDRKLVGEEPGDEISLELIGRNTILRNVTMNSKLSPSISTQIAISAQADPTSNGIEGTLFERFNKGLKDRYIPDKKTDLERILQQQRDERQKLEDSLALAFGYLRFVYGGREFTAQQVTLPGVINEYTLLTKELLMKEGPERSYGGILPFELGLEIEGISGLQVMDSFLINQNILPKSYVGDGNFGFLITGLTHKVDSNGWVVEVKSQIYNRPKGASREASTGTLSFYTPPKKVVKVNHTPWSGPTPNADRVRSVNESLGGMQKNLFDQYPDYKYDELSSGADIQPFLADTTISFLRAFKDRFRRYNIRITAGNDVWHHNYARASQHRYGRGLDFTIRDGSRILGGESDRGTLIEISNWIGTYFANNSDVFYKDEYSPDRQSNHATGNHFHFHVLKNK